MFPPQAVFLLVRCLLAAQPVDLDSGMVRELGFDPAPGMRWTALAADSTGDTTLLLRDGTEHARLDSARWNGARRSRAAIVSAPLRGVGIPRAADLLAWTRPPSGFEAQWSFGSSRSEHSTSVGRQDIALTLDLPWKDWVSAGVMGGFGRTYTVFALDTVSSHPGRVWWPWWGLRACVRSLCWEARTSAQPLPPELWTESKMDSLAGSRENGDLARRWRGDPARLADNWQQSLTARLGVVSWKGTWDAEGWRGVSQEARLAPLPAGPLEWGLLAGRDVEATWTGIVLATRPKQVAAHRGVGVSIRPAEVVFRYSNLNRLAVELRSGFLLRPLERQP